MLGYVLPEKPELKIKEYELYSAYYCGLCKAVGRRYGQLPRLSLNYDLVFLALLLSSASGDAEHIAKEHCILHPIKKKSIVYDSAAIDYAADVMVLLAYYKLKDDYYDERRLLCGGAAALLKRALTPLFSENPALCNAVSENLKALSQLEAAGCSSLDQAAEPFAQLMQRLFTDETLFQAIPVKNSSSAHFPAVRQIKGCSSETDSFSSPLIADTEANRRILSRLGYHLGKWIYLIDALDDIEKDIKNNSYNPLLLRYAYTKKEPPDAFRRRIFGDMEYNLLFCLSEAGKAWELLDSKKNGSIISNILYFGLLRRTEGLLQKGNQTDEQPL